MLLVLMITILAAVGALAYLVYLYRDPEGSRDGTLLSLLRPEKEPRQWLHVPELVMENIIAFCDGQALGNMRLLSKHYHSYIDSQITRLKPACLDAEHMRARFPDLVSLDLTRCVQEVCAVRLRQLHKLVKLTEVIMGMKDEVVPHINDRAMAELAAFRNLKGLDLQNCTHISDQGIMSLIYLTNLERLNLAGCKSVCDLSLVVLDELTNLRDLDISRIPKVSNNGLKALSNLEALTRLDASDCFMLSEEGLKTVSCLTALQELRLMELHPRRVCLSDACLQEYCSSLLDLRSLSIGAKLPAATHITDRGVQRVCAVLTQLTQLTLHHILVTDSGAAHLTRMSELQELELVSSAITAGAMSAIKQLKQLRKLRLTEALQLLITDEVLAGVSGLVQLTELALSGNEDDGTQLRDEALHSSLAHLTNLQVLELQRLKGRLATHRTLEGLKRLRRLSLSGSIHVGQELLAQLAQLPELQELDVSHCSKVCDSALEGLQAASSLISLNLSGCFQVSHRGLAAVARCSSLGRLYLEHCQLVDDQGAAALAPLAQLEHLDLAKCQLVTGRGFAKCKGLGALRSLVLSGCSVDDDGLAGVGSLTGLTLLKLEECSRVGDAGLAALKSLRALRSFELVPPANTSCPVTDAGMRVLGCLSRLQTLRLLNAEGVSEAGVQQLFRLPGLLALHLDGLKALDDNGLAKLATTLTALTSLRVGRCNQLTGASVQLLTKLRRLSNLSVANCRNVNEAAIASLSTLHTLASIEF